MKRFRYCLLMAFSALFICGFAQKDAAKPSFSPQRITFVTNVGKITVRLYNETPMHRDNFLKQAQLGTFDSLLFHRVIKDFMIQSGDPTSKYALPGTFIGDESPEPTLPAEFRYPKLYHKRGALAAARESDDVNPKQESSTRQFYIVWGRTYPDEAQISRMDSVMFARSGKHIDASLREYYRKNPGTPFLDGSYTVFGEVTKGLKVVNRIQSAPTDTNDRPLQDVRILRVIVKNNK